MVFRSWRREEGIWSVPARGGKPKLLAKGGYTPRFSPDGKWIAFNGMASDEIGHAFTIPADGGVPEQLDYGTADAQCPVWSPDGSEIVFAARDGLGRDYDLWVAKTTSQGTNQRARSELSRSCAHTTFRQRPYAHKLGRANAWYLPRTGGTRVFSSRLDWDDPEQRARSG